MVYWCCLRICNPNPDCQHGLVMAAASIAVTTLIPLWLAFGDGILKWAWVKQELYLPRPCLWETMAFTVYIMFILSITPVNNSVSTQLLELLKEYVQITVLRFVVLSTCSVIYSETKCAPNSGEQLFAITPFVINCRIPCHLNKLPRSRLRGTQKIIKIKNSKWRSSVMGWLRGTPW